MLPLRMGIPVAALVITATLGVSGEANAQRTVNDRLDNKPFASGSQAESYLGLTVSDLVVALGLRLQGVRQDEIGEWLRTIRAGQTAPFEHPSASATNNPRRGSVIAVAP